jgi:hypothetical protein
MNTRLEHASLLFDHVVIYLGENPRQGFGSFFTNFLQKLKVVKR